MPMYYPPWDTDAEPNESNIKTWMDNLYGKFEPIEQARWNQSNIDVLFYAGEQRFINSYFNFYPTYNFQNFHFNILQQPINMVTGYQRQHRKSITFTPIEGSKQDFADDLTKLIVYANNYRGVLEKLSVAYEQSAISGMCLIQPYLDYTDDPVNGTLDLRIWPYNSFMCDAYFRELDGSDANFWWLQQYISKQEAVNYFPEKAGLIQTMSGYGNRYGKFYFLPENYNLARNDLLVLSYIWYKTKRKKKMLYNQNDGITYDYADNDKYLDELVANTDFYEVIEVDVPTWKVAVVLNEHLMYLGANPLSFDESPLIPVFWNYDPHVSQFDLRVRSLTRAMRDTQFLMNRRIILNHQISESSLNTGWKYIEDSIVNPEILKEGGYGGDIIVKQGNALTDIEKIIPNAVPPSDMELANQLADLIFRTSGVNQELMGMSDDSKTGIEVMLRQGAGLVTLQKYFDQWDSVLKTLGKLEQKIIQNKWSPSKIARILGKEANVEFLNKTFSKYDVLCAEGLNTTIQQQQQFLQVVQLNEILGGIIPPKFILQNSTIQGKNEIITAVEEREKAQMEAAQQQMHLEHAKFETELQLNTAKAVNEMTWAKERDQRSKADIGLYEERLSMITQNKSMALKNKVEALQKLLEIIAQHGEMESAKTANRLQALGDVQESNDTRERIDAKMETESADYLKKSLEKMNPQQQQGGDQQTRSQLL
jgi:hypothetical protein